MASQITANLPALDFPKEVDYPTQEDWAAFSAAAELNFGILGGNWSAQMQLWKTQANAMSNELNTNATIAQGLANYQGDWTSKGYTLNQTVSVGGIYYICKLTHATGQNPTTGESIYWNLALGNWSLKADKTEVALKIDKDISLYTSKTTPVDADLIPLSDSALSFGIKKLSWANTKATLKTYFDTLYTVASSETKSGIIELATTAEAQAGTDDLRAITPLKLKNSVLGLGQTWQDVTASRVIESIYTNSTGKPIVVTCNSTNTSTGTFGLVAYVGSQQLTTSVASGSNTTGYTTSVSFIVPAGGTYKISKAGATTQTNLWLELR